METEPSIYAIQSELICQQHREELKARVQGISQANKSLTGKHSLKPDSSHPDVQLSEGSARTLGAAEPS